ncbi:hypothetical protein BH11PLA1_BH11PLA1_09820 [soil metagenome]
MAAHSALDPGLLEAVVAGAARLTPAQGLQLYSEMDLSELGRWADARARRVHGDHIRTYIIDRNINYTNICNARCTFCAFRRDEGDADAYTLTTEAIHAKIEALVAIGGTQILMQGGMNPALPLAWYLELLRSIKSRFPMVHVHAFSPPEMIEFVHFFDPPGATLAEKIRWVLVRLKDAGLDSLPGGGGEIFADPVRRKIGLGKCDAAAWLTVMHVAHSLGMFTSATMMFGHIEGAMDRIQHMEMVRRWQDLSLGDSSTDSDGGAGVPPAGKPLDWRALGLRSAGDLPPGGLRTAGTPMGHYVSFISWPFQRENTPLGKVPDWGMDEREFQQEFPGDAVARAWDFGRADAGSGELSLPAGQRAADVYDFDALSKITDERGTPRYPTASLFGRRVRMSSAADYLRTQAISRLYLDNIYSIGASWVTMGPHVGQVALAYGANDMGSVMMEENVVSSAGTTYCLDEPVLCTLIRGAGHVPAQRDNRYDVLRLHDGPNSPDLMVKDWSKHRAKKMHQEAPKVAKVTATVNGLANGTGTRAETPVNGTVVPMSVGGQPQR